MIRARKMGKFCIFVSENLPIEEKMTIFVGK